MALYKFIERRYLDNFFHSGELRLGTVQAYRDTVEYGAVRGDKSEGEHSVIRSIDDTVTLKDNSEPIISEMINLAPGASAHLTNVSFVVKRRSTDAFIFCTSYLYSNTLFNAWNKREGLDACYEILDLFGFTSAIARTVATSARYAGTAKVHYRDEHVDYRSLYAELPGLSKLSDYAWQFETRSIWNPLLPSPPLRPWIVRVPDAVKYCRPFARHEKGVIQLAK